MRHPHPPNNTHKQGHTTLNKLITIHTLKQSGTHTQTLHTHRCKHLQGKEEVCDELNEGSEEEDVMARWVFLPSGAPRESRAGPITETYLDPQSHICKLHTQSRTPFLNLEELGEHNHYYRIQVAQIFAIKKCKSQSLCRCSNSYTHTNFKGMPKRRSLTAA